MTTIKNIFPFFSAIILFGCSSPDNNKTAQQEGKQAEQPKDTTYYLVKRLLNRSPKEVEKVLGKPDGKIKETNDCTYLPHCSVANYQSEKYELEYYNNKVKCVTLNLRGEKPYDANFLDMINFAQVPTISNDFNIRWKGIEGIGEIVIFPQKPSGINYALIEVEKDYDKKFEIIGVQSLAIQKDAAREEDASRKEKIKKQFSGWDGSNEYVVKAIKKNMNDPDSYEHESTKYVDYGDHIRVVTVFRGKNSFGAKVLNTAYADVTPDGEIIKLTIE